jgi:succinoglycan biosynthesis protein ExoM
MAEPRPRCGVQWPTIYDEEQMERVQRAVTAGGEGSVDICVCTYRRESLATTLRSIADQTGLGARRLRVIVADNDEQPTAEAAIRRMGETMGLPLHYRHAPARSISISRNACLDAADADWIAFLDDDEQARPAWLSCLLAEAETGGWDAVLGPVLAVYSDAAPAWMRSGDFHSTRPVIRKGAIETGYSGNVLIRRATVEREGLRFDLKFGRTGGEDVDFFYRLRDAGGRIGFAPEAWVDEPVPDTRASLRWLLARTFRAGQTHGTRLARLEPAPVSRFKQAGVAAAKAMACGSAALATVAQPVTRNRFITRGAMHLGVLARVAGIPEIQLY